MISVPNVQHAKRRRSACVVVGRLSDFGVGNEKYENWDEVRAAQVEVAKADPEFRVGLLKQCLVSKTTWRSILLS